MTGPDDRCPRELRVHGVGGSPGPRLLGFDLPTSVETVGEGVGGSAIIARRDDETIEGYDWGNLTSGSGTQALWVFLLPFTVLNAAGWMHPRDLRWGRVVRATVHVLSVLLGATYVFSQAILLVDLVGYQWTRRIFCPDPAACRHGILIQQWLGVAGGLLLLLLAAGALVVIAGRSQARFEDKALPHALKEAARADRTAPRDPQDRLDSPTFFWHPEAAKRLLNVHRTALGIAWLAVVALTLTRMLAARRPSRLHLDGLLVAVNVPSAVAVGLLWMVALLILVRRHRPAPATAGPAAIAGPAIAATLAFTPLVAVYSGTFLFAIKRLSDWPKRPPGAPPLDVGAAIAFVDMWGGVVVAAAVLAGLGALLMLRKPHGQTDDIPERSSGPGWSLDGADPSWRSAIASKRSAAWLAHHADWAALLIALGLWVTAVVSFLLRTRVHFLLGIPFIRLDIHVPANPTSVPYSIGAYVLTLVPLFLITLLRQAQGSRTFVSTIWDVLTFLPRRFAPLAVRCYAERAVPEFQGRIDYHIRRFDRPVVISAHSQGSIIAFAAIASLPEDCARKVALVTYGSPITSIFGRFFPEYFGSEAIAKVLRKLNDPAPDIPAWCNFYRRTDPIGDRVFVQEAAKNPPHDIELDDPMPPPAVPWPPVPGEAPLEHDRPVWTQIAVHSYYLNEPALKQWVVRLKSAMATPTPAGGYTDEEIRIG